MLRFNVNKAKKVIEVSGTIPMTGDNIRETDSGYFLSLGGGFALKENEFMVENIDRHGLKDALKTQVKGIENLEPYFSAKCSLTVGFKASKSSKIDLSFLK